MDIFVNGKLSFSIEHRVLSNFPIHYLLNKIKIKYGGFPVTSIRLGEGGGGGSNSKPINPENWFNKQLSLKLFSNTDGSGGGGSGGGGSGVKFDHFFETTTTNVDNNNNNISSSSSSVWFNVSKRDNLVLRTCKHLPDSSTLNVFIDNKSAKDLDEKRKRAFVEELINDPLFAPIDDLVVDLFYPKISVLVNESNVKNVVSGIPIVKNITNDHYSKLVKHVSSLHEDEVKIVKNAIVCSDVSFSGLSNTVGSNFLLEVNLQTVILNNLERKLRDDIRDTKNFILDNWKTRVASNVTNFNKYVRLFDDIKIVDLHQVNVTLRSVYIVNGGGGSGSGSSSSSDLSVTDFNHLKKMFIVHYVVSNSPIFIMDDSNGNGNGDSSGGGDPEGLKMSYISTTTSTPSSVDYSSYSSSSSFPHVTISWSGDKFNLSKQPITIVVRGEISDAYTATEVSVRALETLVKEIAINNKNKSSNKTTTPAGTSVYYANSLMNGKVPTQMKNKKLLASDPVMFNFKESVTSKVRFSKLCQKKFYPSIYNMESEIPSKLAKHAVKLKNLTTGDDVWYTCKDNPNASFLGFITGEHPDGNYCLPCCRVKEQSSKPFHNQCLTTGCSGTVDKSNRKRYKAKRVDEEEEDDDDNDDDPSSLSFLPSSSSSSLSSSRKRKGRKGRKDEDGGDGGDGDGDEDDEVALLLDTLGAKSTVLPNSSTSWITVIDRKHNNGLLDTDFSKFDYNQKMTNIKISPLSSSSTSKTLWISASSNIVTTFAIALKNRIQSPTFLNILFNNTNNTKSFREKYYPMTLDSLMFHYHDKINKIILNNLQFACFAVLKDGMFIPLLEKQKWIYGDKNPLITYKIDPKEFPECTIERSLESISTMTQKDIKTIENYLLVYTYKDKPILIVYANRLAVIVFNNKSSTTTNYEFPKKTKFIKLTIDIIDLFNNNSVINYSNFDTWYKKNYKLPKPDSNIDVYYKLKTWINAQVNEYSNLEFREKIIKHAGYMFVHSNPVDIKAIDKFMDKLRKDIFLSNVVDIYCLLEIISKSMMSRSPSECHEVFKSLFSRTRFSFDTNIEMIKWLNVRKLTLPAFTAEINKTVTASSPFKLNKDTLAKLYDDLHNPFIIKWFTRDITDDDHVMTFISHNINQVMNDYMMLSLWL